MIEEFDINENGHIDDEDMALLEAAAGLMEEFGIGDEETEDDESDHVEPSTVHSAPPTVQTAPPTVQTAPPVLLAPPVVRVPVASESNVPSLRKLLSTPDHTDHMEYSHPSEYVPNWNKHAILNDTRKHHTGFKLFAELRDSSPSDLPKRFAVHARQHEDRKDIWNVKLFPSMDQGMKGLKAAGLNFDDLLKMAPPSGKSFLQEMKAFNSHQPRWNIADNRLKTLKNNSEPINDDLYFRLFEDKVTKDTSDFHGHVFRSMLTTNSNKDKYQKEKNAKLIGKKSWQLVREPHPSFDYTLKNKDTKGGFYWCLDSKALASMEAISRSKPSTGSMQSDNVDIVESIKALGDITGGELKYMDSTETAVTFNKGATTCRALTLMVR